MSTNGHKTIAWIDDIQASIANAVTFLENINGFKIEVYKDPTNALDDIAHKKLNPDLIIFDLQFSLDGKKEPEGLKTARTAVALRPDIPVVAVTEYLFEYSDDIAEDFTLRKLPFLRIWQKKNLREGEESLARFALEIDLLCRTEYNTGKVMKIEGDYTEVLLKTQEGVQYRRYFDTQFLNAIGIRKAGEKVGILFWKTADINSGHVHMQLNKIGDREEVSIEEIKKIISQVDMNKVREKFPSRMTDSAE
ncbi:hypothetical protein ACFLVX_04560 [Chloroflexota bacterium]